eukprot:comp23161_c0_seq1/m.37465 comp23161_c0_seq1/g.37465  ORF comp23161_c0_seq1/g.37465 comp23161_c0_seq1/m.37465 type:complete len:639 (-) comp23161_c0_seq1:47-1963(-)
MGIPLPRMRGPILLRVIFATALIARGVVATPVSDKHVGPLSIAARDVPALYKETSEPPIAEYDVDQVETASPSTSEPTESIEEDRDRVHDHIEGPFVAYKPKETDDNSVRGNDVLIIQEDASDYVAPSTAHETQTITPLVTFAAWRRDVETEVADSKLNLGPIADDTDTAPATDPTGGIAPATDPIGGIAPAADPTGGIDDLPNDESQSDLESSAGNDTTGETWATWTDEPPPLPVVTCQGALPCPGDIAVVANGTTVAVCQMGKPLAQVIADVPDWSVILLAKDEHVSAEILLAKNLVIRGCKPDGGKAIITTDINVEEGCIFRIGGRSQRLEFYDLSLERTGLGFASAIRTWERLETDTSDLIGSLVWLVIEGCEFKNFYTRARGGAAIFIDSMSDFSLRGSLIQGNRVNIVGERFDGGGAVWILWVDNIRKAEVKDCVFQDNHHEFQHGVGGALMFDNVMGRVDIIGNAFTSNSASGGGALMISGINELATVTIDSKFENNTATEFGWGSRGGAAWIERINGTLIIRGEFVNNNAPSDRGGAIANNGIMQNASVTIDAQFGYNNCSEGGAAWDTLGVGFRNRGKLTLKSTCTFEGNTGEMGRIIRLTRPVGKSTFTREAEWNGSDDVVYEAQLIE